ncbi:hypothetical protein MMC07_006899 [Pseudocyphellaria aurata]|nr:hypothetical protein [Pseudocyphellaria aurata]
MGTIYTMLGFLALTLASVFSTQPRIESVHGLGSGRGLMTKEPPEASTSTSSINSTTHSPASSADPAAHSLASTDLPSQTSFTLPQQSQWGPRDISNLLFGAIASILGIVTVGMTYYLHRRQSEGQESDDSMELDIRRSFEPSDHDDGGGGVPHEDLPPAHTSVDSSANTLS